MNDECSERGEPSERRDTPPSDDRGRRILPAVAGLTRRLMPAILGATFVLVSASHLPAGPARDSAIAGRREEAPSVLIVNSYHPGFVWSDNLMDGAVETLKDRFPHAQTAVVFMDTKRHFDGPDGVFVAEFQERLALKYEPSEFDLLFATDDNAFRFLLEHGSDLFDRTPVVFAGVNHLDEVATPEPRRFTGVVEKPEYGRTIDLALSIYPNPPQILVVSDQTTTGRGNRRKIAEQLRARGLQQRAIYSAGRDDLTTAELERLVALVPPGGFIFFADFHVDAHGNAIFYERFLPRLSAAASVPIFTYTRLYLGHGPVGGKVVSGYEHGVAGARKAIRVLEGEPPSTVPIDSGLSNTYVFDHEQLKRFGIGWRQIPVGSTIINEPDSVWYEYRLPLLGAAAVFVLQSILVGVLIWSVRRRKAMERELRRSLDENRALLQEVHHRVKNNLQIISSMIHLARKDDQVNAHTFAVETENRIRALALMHESLYQGESLSAVDLSAYLRELSGSVAESLNVRRSVIDFTSEVSECHVPMDLAIPCGLITNELVTNSVKYGVPSDGQAQRIGIELSRAENGAVRLTVRDNGPGFPGHGPPEEAAGLGLTLVQSLARQIRGSVEFTNGDGFSCAVDFSSC